VIVPGDAQDRGGPQPVVHLTVNSGKRADIACGDEVTFTAEIAVPPGMGQIVSAHWDFEGGGDFPLAANFEPAERIMLTATHRYDSSGTRFPGIRVAAHRNRDMQTPYARVLNLDTVRVVVD